MILWGIVLYMIGNCDEALKSDNDNWKKKKKGFIKQKHPGWCKGRLKIIDARDSIREGTKVRIVI